MQILTTPQPNVKGLYSWLLLEPESVLRLNTLITNVYGSRVQDLFNPTEYHMTLMYDQSGQPKNADVPTTLYEVNAAISNIRTWVDHKGRNILVALLNDEWIQALHQRVANAGYTHSYPDYNPHISLGFSDQPIKNTHLQEYEIKVKFTPNIYYSLTF